MVLPLERELGSARTLTEKQSSLVVRATLRANAEKVDDSGNEGMGPARR